jgi:CheY-like chemotaxis protein
VVLLDLSMPRLGGLEALPAERDALARGADAFVAKGSDPDLVARALLGAVD